MLTMKSMARDQKILEFQQKAPFTGVLVPEYEYREMTADILMTDAFKADLRECLDSRFNTSENKMTYYIGGIAIGISFTILAYKIFK